MDTREAFEANIRRNCPLKIPGHTEAGCCRWDTFLASFCGAWPRWFDKPPTAAQWSEARGDWRAGNTGWEAAHNAKSRARERRTN